MIYLIFNYCLIIKKYFQNLLIIFIKFLFIQYNGYFIIINFIYQLKFILNYYF